MQVQCTIILAAQSMYNYGTWSRPQTRPHHLGPSAARASGENAIDDIIIERTIAGLVY